jgi:hypothetical protein
MYMEGNGLLIYIYINGCTFYGIELSYENYFFGDLIYIYVELMVEAYFYISVTNYIDYISVLYGNMSICHNITILLDIWTGSYKYICKRE